MKISVSLFLVAALALPANAADGKRVVLQDKPAFEQNIGQLPDEVLYLVREYAVDAIGIGAFYIRQGGFTIAPDQVRIDFVGASDAVPVGSKPQPGVVNTFEGNDPSRWVTGAKRFGAVTVGEVYPGISLSYRADEDGFRLIWSAAPHADLSTLRWKVSNAGASIGSLDRLALGVGFGIPVFVPAPTATQTGLGGTRELQARWVTVDKNVEIALEGRDPAQWMRLEILVPRPTTTAPARIDAASGDYYGADSVNDLVWRDVPISFQGEAGEGLCGWSQRPSLCRSVRVVRFDPQGHLRYVSYFGGERDDRVGSILSDGEGGIWIAGSTESPDLPVTAGALQPFLNKPSSSIRGSNADWFLARLDGRTGSPTFSTYLGADEPVSNVVGELAVGETGDAFFHGHGHDGLPTTAGAISDEGCIGCAFVSRWDKAGQLRYLTYFPASVTVSRALGDGSLLVGGHASNALSVIPGAKVVGVPARQDAFVAKVGPQGNSTQYALVFATGDDDEVKDLAVDSAGRIWVYLESTLGFGPTSRRLLQLAPNGSTILKQFDLTTDLSSLTVDADDSLYAFRGEGDASYNCGLKTMVRVDETGTMTDFEQRDPTAVIAGFDADQRPILRTNNVTFEAAALDERSGDWIACAKNGTTFVYDNSIAPGEIITLFGNGLGPDSGVTFTPVNGRVPLDTGGTRVFFSGIAAPVLYAQDAQVNAVAPFSLVPGEDVTIRIDFQERTNEVVASVVEYHPQFFVAELINDRDYRAAAINEDGTQNNLSTPARPGEAVSLYLSGAGINAPALVENEIAVGAGWPPLQEFDVFYQDDARGTLRRSGILNVEYIGTAPGLTTGVLQMNVRLPGLNGFGPLGTAGRVSLSFLAEGKEIGVPAFIYVCTSTANCPR